MPTASRTVGNRVILNLEGKLTVGPEVDEFRTRWSEAVVAGVNEVIVDLSRVRMVDSSGIGSLIRCHSAVSARGGKVRLVGANDMVRHAFRVTRLEKVFEFHDTLEDALS